MRRVTNGGIHSLFLSRFLPYWYQTFHQSYVSILQETKLNRIAGSHLLFSHSIPDTVLRAVTMAVPDLPRNTSSFRGSSLSAHQSYIHSHVFPDLQSPTLL